MNKSEKVIPTETIGPMSVHQVELTAGSKGRQSKNYEFDCSGLRFRFCRV